MTGTNIQITGERKGLLSCNGDFAILRAFGNSLSRGVQMT